MRVALLCLHCSYVNPSAAFCDTVCVDPLNREELLTLNSLENMQFSELVSYFYWERGFSQLHVV